MHMSFWWSYNVINFLFKGVSVNTGSGLLVMCLCVASMSFFFEFLKYLQAKQRQKELMLRSRQLRTICPNDTSTLLASNESTTCTTNSANPIVITKLDRTCLFGAELSLWFLLQNLGYILMLSIMLYNGWLFIAAVCGGGLGYFIFGQKFMKINLQNCQIIRETFCMQKCGEPDPNPDDPDQESED